MKDKELKRLNRAELLELLLAESRRSTALEEKLKRAKEQLASRELQKERAGSLAEAALNVNSVLEAADAAAKQFLENVERRHAEAEAEAAKLLTQTQERCEAMIAQAEREAAAILEAARQTAAPLQPTAEEAAAENPTQEKAETNKPTPMKHAGGNRPAASHRKKQSGRKR